MKTPKKKIDFDVWLRIERLKLERYLLNPIPEGLKAYAEGKLFMLNEVSEQYEMRNKK